MISVACIRVPFQSDSKSLRVVLQFLAFFGCVIAGNLLYFFGLGQGLWLPYLIGLALYLWAIISLVNNLKRSTAPAVAILIALSVYLLTVLVSALINQISLTQLVVGGKSLVALFSVFLVVSYGSLRLVSIERQITLLLPLVFVQVPFVLYQNLFVASARSTKGGSSGVAWDAVVGTFGGDPNGGGASGALGFAISSALILAIALWNRSELSTKKTLLVIIAAFLCLALSEVKVVALFTVIGILVLTISGIKEKPLTMLSMGILGGIFGACLLLFYANTYVYEDGRKPAGVSDALIVAVEGSLDEKLINHETGEMSRMAAISLWAVAGMGKSDLKAIIGYGPGASRSASTVAIGEVAARYNFNIDRSTAVQILWEVGILGLLVLVFMLTVGCLHAMVLSRSSLFTSREKAILETSSAILAISIVMLPYSREFLEVPAVTIISMTCMGYVIKASMLLQSRKRLAEIRRSTEARR